MWNPSNTRITVADVQEYAEVSWDTTLGRELLGTSGYQYKKWGSCVYREVLCAALHYKHISGPKAEGTVFSMSIIVPKPISGVAVEVVPLPIATADTVRSDAFCARDRRTLKQSFIVFLRFTSSAFGFLVSLYALNVVAWGGMLFLLLVGACSKTMCFVDRNGLWVHDCGDLESPRRIWIEYDSQILTALFCVPAFGLLYWRARDLFYLLWFRWTGNKYPLRKIAAWHRGWFRLPGSDQLNAQTNEPRDARDLEAFPEPISKAPDVPSTGVRPIPTRLWLMDAVVWSAIGNTGFQVVLCVFMWSMGRENRPSWATGTFVALGCVSGGLGGFLQYKEGKRIKAVEGQRM